MTHRAAWLLACVLFVAPALSTAEGLNAGTIRLNSNQAHVFPAQFSRSEPPNLFVIDGQDLRMYPLPEIEPRVAITLPSSASAVDVFDTDGDGVCEVLVVAGSSVLLGTLSDDGQGAMWKTILERVSLYSNSTGSPFPQVMAARVDDETVIALPQSNGFELWTAQGKLRTTLPYGEPVSAGDFAIAPLQREPLDAAAAGAGVTMAHRISSQGQADRLTSSSEPALVSNGPSNQPSEAPPLDVAELPSDLWPSFPLETNAAPEIVVLYAPTPPRFEDSFIRFQQSSTTGAPVGVAGPQRRYPGRVFESGNVPPDFNRDGFVELVCWKPAPPGSSWSNLMNALTRGTWPVSISVHPYDPARRIFATEPAGFIKTDLPSAWFGADSASPPLRNVCFNDVDGDGSPDFGFSTRANRYSIWTYRLGFNADPEFEIITPGPVDSVVFDASFHSEHDRTLTLRGPHALYVIAFPTG